ncbi:helix-turn-helix domain-containing protein [Kitasatospora sp. NPDC087861]|uniref:helix-turn-helix domain-containing protein n=1 Tax=Kitasatospora sp. NPDC087861 TaxID=3364070 RepID=UPI0038133C0D
MSHDRSAFGTFLRARRDRLTPAQVGIDAFPGPRRVPGLRREELAMLAGLSTDRYSRLEQGWQATVSEMEADRRPGDQRLIAAVHDLRRTDPDVARWWDDHTVRDYASVPKRIAHPEAGPLDFDIEIVTASHALDQHLIVYTVEPDSSTARVLPILASWATPANAPTGPQD